MENQREVKRLLVIKTKGLEGPSTARAKSIKESTQHVVSRHAGITVEGY